MNFEHLLAGRTEMMGANAIREILKVVSQPGMVSLAGGIPSPDSFPMEIIKTLTENVMEKYGSDAFQYGLTEGFMPLRAALGDLLKERGISAAPEDIHVTSGSQGVLDGVAKILISRKDKIAVEAPTYLGAISAFNPYQPEYVCMDTDDGGVIPESLEAVLGNNAIKFIYLVPTFQNPTGRTLSLKRREKIAEIITRENALLVEDDPYSALRYRGSDIPPIKTLAPDHVVYISTLSKIFAPGLRIGFYAAPELMRKWLVLVKQGVDLHTSTFNQALAAEYLSGGYMKAHLPVIKALYKPKQEAMLSAIQKYFPKNFTCSPSEGGMFLWVRGPEGYDMTTLYQRSVEKNIAFVPGCYFYTNPMEGIETMRLNYTMSDVETIDAAIEKLSLIIKDVD
ncbi:MAG: PLP-dependent aminotransferase family protein [Desulfobacterium sp.]|nr:PLP-dependent aminotransferase family protein [Desulfobacterium sp.]